MKLIQFKPLSQGSLRSQSGQLVIEYVLLLSISVAIALVLVSQFVRRGDDPENVGSIISKWNQMQEQIGKDQQE